MQNVAHFRSCVNLHAKFHITPYFKFKHEAKENVVPDYHSIQTKSKITQFRQDYNIFFCMFACLRAFLLSMEKAEGKQKRNVKIKVWPIKSWYQRWSFILIHTVRFGCTRNIYIVARFPQTHVQGEWIFEGFWSEQIKSVLKRNVWHTHTHAYRNWNEHPISLVNWFDAIQNIKSTYAKGGRRHGITGNAVWPIRLHSFSIVCIYISVRYDTSAHRLYSDFNNNNEFACVGYFPFAAPHSCAVFGTVYRWFSVFNFNLFIYSFTTTS